MNALVVQFRMFLLLAFSVNIMNLDEVKLCGLEKRIRFHFKAQKDYGTQLRKKIKSTQFFYDESKVQQFCLVPKLSEKFLRKI